MIKRKMLVLLSMTGLSTILAVAQPQRISKSQSFPEAHQASWGYDYQLFTTSDGPATQGMVLTGQGSVAGDMSVPLRFRSVSPLATARGELPKRIAYSLYDLDFTPPQRVDPSRPPVEPFPDPMGDMPWGLLLLMVAGYGYRKTKSATYKYRGL